jgi:hypothetical protein
MKALPRETLHYNSMTAYTTSCSCCCLSALACCPHSGQPSKPGMLTAPGRLRRHSQGKNGVAAVKTIILPSKPSVLSSKQTQKLKGLPLHRSRPPGGYFESLQGTLHATSGRPSSAEASKHPSAGADSIWKGGETRDSPGRTGQKSRAERHAQKQTSTHTLSSAPTAHTPPGLARARCGTYKDGRRKSSLVHVNQCVPKALHPAWLHDHRGSSKRWWGACSRLSYRGAPQASFSVRVFQSHTLQARPQRGRLEIAHCPRPCPWLFRSSARPPAPLLRPSMHGKP